MSAHDVYLRQLPSRAVSNDEAERLREHDLAALRALLDSEKITEKEVESFEDMLSSISGESPRFVRLTDKQRGWVDNRCKFLDIDVDDPHERNKDVPRGGDVPLPAVLRRENLPKRPPRKVQS